MKITTAQELLTQLETWNVSHVTKSHKPVFTVEESKEIEHFGSPEGHCKNLLLRDKKKRMYLVTVQQDVQVDLKALAEIVKSKRLSFASPDRLMQYLGVIPGAVSPLALINDTGIEVEFWLGKTLAASEYMYFHPLDNSMTTEITFQGFMSFLAKTKHASNILEEL